MQQQVEKRPIDAVAAQSRSVQAAAAAPRGREAAALWRALACVIVMLEFTSQAAHRADRLHRRAETLLGRLSRLQTEIVGERAQIATARRELVAVEALRALLRAPDAGMMTLSPPSPVASAAGHSLAAARRPEATLAIAPKEHRAVLIVAGLKPPPADTLYVLWWRAARGASVRAAGFRTAADGSALLMAAIPSGLEVTGAMITIERIAAERAAKDGAANAAQASAQRAPAGPVQLRGTLARASGRGAPAD